MILEEGWRYIVAFWLVLFHLALCRAAGEDSQDNEFIGWHGATYDPKSAFGHGIDQPVKISEQPLSFVWKNFISKSEAKHIATLSAPRMRQSLVGDDQEITTTRSSYGTFIPRYQDETIAKIEERIVNWTGVPPVHHEEIQVLRYSPGQNYIKHMDSHGRMATLLIYLTDTPEGGETAFPSTTDAHWMDLSLKPAGLSPDCAEGHVAVKPEVGTALLFYSMPPGAEADASVREQIDPYSLHTGCPPAEGQIKWTATVWIHAEPFRPEGFSTELPKPKLLDIGDCVDYSRHCIIWMVQGMCTANATFMAGGDGQVGQCERACRVCTRCEEGDYACKVANRERSGFLGDLEPELAQLFPEEL